MTTLFNNGSILVEMNHTNEVFVTNLDSKACIRIGKYASELKITSSTGHMYPTILNNCAGIAVGGDISK